MKLSSKTPVFSTCPVRLQRHRIGCLNAAHSQVPAQATSAVLRIALPNGGVLEHAYARAADAAAIDARSLIGSTAADGIYRYELVFAQNLDASTAQAAAQARKNGNDAALAGLPAPLLPISRLFCSPRWPGADGRIDRDQCGVRSSQ